MAASRVAPPTIYGQCISKIAWYVATFRATAAISSVESRRPRWQLGAEGSPGLQVAVSVVNRPASYTYIRVSYGTIGDNLHIAPKKTTSGTTKRMPQRDRQVQRDCDMRCGTARHHRDDAAGVFVALGLFSLPSEKFFERHQLFGNIWQLTPSTGECPNLLPPATGSSGRVRRQGAGSRRGVVPKPLPVRRRRP
jgi:hypothetical protein